LYRERLFINNTQVKCYVYDLKSSYDSPNSSANCLWS
jgi:hypothetical protein